MSLGGEYESTRCVAFYKLACYPPTPRLALIILVLWYSRILQFNYYYSPEILAIMLDH